MRSRIQITKVIAIALLFACAVVARAEHGQLGSAPEPDTIPETVPEEKAALEAHAPKDTADAATTDSQKAEVATGQAGGEGRGRYIRSKDGEGERK
jgi:hypothetical protein